jgi:hypothetical protein
MTSRLDDGRSHEVDPGKHVVRFVHAGKETTVKVVLNQGEKGRLVVATFVDDQPSASSSTSSSSASADLSSTPKRPIFPLVVAGLGGAAAVTGGVLLGVGMSGVPSNCNVGSRECAAPANDPSLEKAQSSMSLANVGLAVGIAGAVTLIGGLVWYLASPPSGASSQRGYAPTPYVTF